MFTINFITIANCTFNAWASTERDALLCEVSDLGKEVLGVRPRWLYSASNAELREAIAGFRAELREIWEREAADAEREAAALVASAPGFPLALCPALAGL